MHESGDGSHDQGCQEAVIGAEDVCVVAEVRVAVADAEAVAAVVHEAGVVARRDEEAAAEDSRAGCK